MAQAQTTSAADGRVLCYAEFGDLGGYPVFSLHGTPGCRLLSSRSIEFDLEGVVRSLGVRLIRYDRPGYGGSDPKPGRLISDSASDLEAVADAVGVARFAVVGSSGGTPPALAAGALLPERVERIAIVAPLALLPREEFLRGTNEEGRAYIEDCFAGEGAMLKRFAREDAEYREAAAEDPRAADTFEQTRNGLQGWLDDDAGWALRPWGFEIGDVGQRVQVWYDPADQLLPPQHPHWLAEHLHNATLHETDALGHGSEGDPRADWRALYGWLAGA
ncbi:MAG TPA: alpha/beta hydrolase [Candidatus Dormibacteraeota bacterium]